MAIKSFKESITQATPFIAELDTKLKEPDANIENTINLLVAVQLDKLPGIMRNKFDTYFRSLAYGYLEQYAKLNAAAANSSVMGPAGGATGLILAGAFQDDNHAIKTLSGLDTYKVRKKIAAVADNVYEHHKDEADVARLVTPNIEKKLDTAGKVHDVLQANYSRDKELSFEEALPIAKAAHHLDKYSKTSGCLKHSLFADKRGKQIAQKLMYVSSKEAAKELLNTERTRFFGEAATKKKDKALDAVINKQIVRLGS